MEWMLMPLRRYAEFTGRSRRQEFWMFQLMLVILGFVAVMAMFVIGFGMVGVAPSGSSNAAAAGMMGMFASMGIFAVVFLIVGLALFIPSLAVQVRRLHDTDRSGWWLMIYFGPYLLSIVINLAGSAQNSMAIVGIGGIVSLLSLVGWVTLIVFYCLPGTVGPNQYGPDPLGGASNLAETFR